MGRTVVGQSLQQNQRCLAIGRRRIRPSQRGGDSPRQRRMRSDMLQGSRCHPTMRPHTCGTQAWQRGHGAERSRRCSGVRGRHQGAARTRRADLAVQPRAVATVDAVAKPSFRGTPLPAVLPTAVTKAGVEAAAPTPMPNRHLPGVSVFWSQKIGLRRKAVSLTPENRQAAGGKGFSQPFAPMPENGPGVPYSSFGRKSDRESTSASQRGSRVGSVDLRPYGLVERLARGRPPALRIRPLGAASEVRSSCSKSMKNECNPI